MITFLNCVGREPQEYTNNGIDVSLDAKSFAHLVNLSSYTPRKKRGRDFKTKSSLQVSGNAKKSNRRQDEKGDERGVEGDKTTAEHEGTRENTTEQLDRRARSSN